MPYDKKQVVLDKLTKLIELLEEVHEGDDNNIFHPDWIEVTDIISNVERSGAISKETLDRMNVVWRTNQSIKKYKLDHNGELPPEDALDIEAVALLKIGKKINAIKFIRENKLTELGGLMSLVDAKKYVEDLAEKNGIK